jgi:hypothetical protein
MKRAVFTGIAFCVAFSAAAAVAAPAAPTVTTAPAAAPAATDAPAVVPKAKTVKVTKPAAPADWTGSWTGSLAQVGRASPYAFAITLAGKAGQTTYPGQNCTGKLVRVGTSGDYAFFVETITAGKFDPATKAGCLDGSLTLQKSGGGLVMTWMTAYEGKVIVAYGALQAKAK